MTRKPKLTEAEKILNEVERFIRKTLKNGTCPDCLARLLIIFGASVALQHGADAAGMLQEFADEAHELPHKGAIQ